MLVRVCAAHTTTVSNTHTLPHPQQTPVAAAVARPPLLLPAMKQMFGHKKSASKTVNPGPLQQVRVCVGVCVCAAGRTGNGGRSPIPFASQPTSSACAGPARCRSRCRPDTFSFTSRLLAGLEAGGAHRHAHHTAHLHDAVQAGRQARGAAAEAEKVLF